MIDILGACANVVVPEASQEAMSFYRSGNLLWILNQAWGFIVPLLFLVTGFSGRLRTFAAKIGKNWYGTIAVYLVLFIALVQLLDFPLDYYGGFVRQHAYGLSTQSLAGWMRNWTVSLALGLVFALAFVWIFYWLIKKSPRRWWIYGSCVAIAITLFVAFIQPMWIDPLYNTYGPMKNKELEAKILALASKAGIQNGRIYEVNKSAETKSMNAYVIGIGKSNRIVLWDTIIAGMTTDELLFVMGHEMGHYVLHHVWWLLGFASIVIFVMFYFLYKSVYYLTNRYRNRFGFNSISDIASVPLFVLLMAVFSFFLAPLANWDSRMFERNADTFGIEITQNNTAAGEAFLVLQKNDFVNPRPGPLYVFWRCSHPTLAARVAFFNSYCPWTEGKPLKYGKHFSENIP